MKRRWLGAMIIGVLLSSGCAAHDTHSVAREQAQTYYGRPYEQLSPEEKMRLEDHVAKQSNTAWRTDAQVASGLGRLLQGVGVLIVGATR